MQENGPTETNDGGTEQRPAVEPTMSVDKPSDTQAHHRGAEQGKRNPPNWVEIGLFVFTGLYFFTTCVYCFFSFQQWQAMEQSNIASNKVADANQSLAATAAGALAESRVLNALTARGVAQAQRQVAVSERQAEVGERAFQLQHRASLEVVEASPYEPIDGKDGKVGITIVNKGDVWAAVSVHWNSRIDRSVINGAGQAADSTAEYRLDPGQTGEIPVTILSLDAAHIRVVADPQNESVLFLFGWVSYRDETGNAGTIDFCWTLRPKPAWQKCRSEL